MLNNKATSTLTCQGTAPVTAFSGHSEGRDNPADTDLENVGPLPEGTYYHVDRQSGGYFGYFRDLWDAYGYGSTDRRLWFMLWNPASGDETNINGIKRGNFRLHPIGRLRLSDGCITVVNPYEFDRLQKFIRSKKAMLPVPGSALRAYGTVEVK